MIAIIIGTNRPGSSTRQVARHIEEIYRDLGVSAKTVDLAELPLDVFAPTAYDQKPKDFLPFAETILQAAGLVVVTPEYNGGPPGVLKHFIDVLKHPDSLCMRPVCFVGLSAGIWGGLRPVEQLQQIFGYRNAYIYPERVFLPRVHDLLSDLGRITNVDIMARLKFQATGFVDYVERLQGLKLRPV